MIAQHFRKVTLLRKCVIVLLFLLSIDVHASTAWQLYEDKQGVSVYFQKAADNTIKMKAAVTIENRTAADFIALLSDTNVASDWIENITEVKLLKYLSPSENLVYSYIDSPWPVANRDVVTYSCYSQVNSQQTRLSIHARPRLLPKTKGVVRISTLKATWLLTQQVNNLHIKYQVYALPGGSIPMWLNNRVALKSTYNTLKNLSDILISRQYKAQPKVIRTGDCTHSE